MKQKILLSIVIGVSFLVHISYLTNGFTWLDHNDIESKQAILPLSQIAKIFTTPFGRTAFYRPFVTLTYSIDSALYGTHAFGFHLTNLLLHIIVIGVSLLFLGSFFKLSRQEKITAALIIGIHPVTSIIIGSITQRQEPLVLIFMMLTIFFHALFRKKSSLLYGICTGLSFLAALFSKETAIVVTPMVIIFWEIVSHKTSKKNNRLYSNIYGVESIILAIYLLLRFHSVRAVWGTKSLSLSFDEAIGTRLSLVFRWLSELILPIKPPFSDAVYVLRGFHPVSLFVIVIIIFSIYLLRRFGLKSTYGTLLVLFAIFLAPGLNIIPVPRVGSPHYSYLPLIPSAGVISILVWRSPVAIKKFMIIILCVWGGIASYNTYVTGFQFKSDLTLFSSEVKSDHNFLEGYQYLGDYHFFRNDLAKAEMYYKKSLQKKYQILAFVDTVSVLNNFAGVRVKQNRLEDADILLLRISNPPLIVFYNRALIAYKLGDHRTVVTLLMPRLSIWKQAEPLLLLANSLHILGRDTEEFRVLSTALPYLSESQKKIINQKDSLH